MECYFCNKYETCIKTKKVICEDFNPMDYILESYIDIMKDMREIIDKDLINCPEKFTKEDAYLIYKIFGNIGIILSLNKKEF